MSSVDKQKLDEVKGTVLFEGEESITEGTITLNDDKDNYKRIRIYNAQFCWGEVLVSEGSSQTAYFSAIGNSNGTNFLLFALRVRLTGTSCQIMYNGRKIISTSVTEDSTKAGIIKIVGYKY